MKSAAANSTLKGLFLLNSFLSFFNYDFDTLWWKYVLNIILELIAENNW